jgi:RHS repeat-associated protein
MFSNGNSSFITDATGYAEQHIQYLPFGELFVSQRNTSFDSRYKFTAKELDNETNYSYFGARYYDSDISIWLSVDPLADKYPSFGPYVYCYNNPVLFIDRFGLEGENPDYGTGKQTNFSKIKHLKHDPSRTKKSTLNIMVMGNGTNGTDTDPTVGWSQEELNDPNTLAMYVQDMNDFENQLKTLTSQYDVEIGNVFISSHGNPKNAKTNVGGTPITKDNIGFLKNYTSSSSIIFLLSCNAGNENINGPDYLQSIALATGRTTMGSQVRVGLGGKPGSSIYNNSTRGYAPDALVLENWDQNSGWFTIATPNSKYKAYDARISSSGQIKFNSPLLPLTSKK